MTFASLFPAFLALASMSEGVYAQSTPAVEPVVEYTFDNSTDPTKNTGSGDSSLDGVLFPAEDNGISFPENAALFNGTGCIEVPVSYDINCFPIQMRTILLDFTWDGTSNPNGEEPQILYEEGGNKNGVNIVISPTDQSGTAELVMGVWEATSNNPRISFVNATIQTGTRYEAAFVLHRTGTGADGSGTVAGYLNGTLFDSEEIDWFDIKAHTNRNCLGGMIEGSRIFGGMSSDAAYNDGLYFHGQIYNFQLYNSIEIPTSQGQTRSLRGKHDQ